jgi:lipoprotein NlpD
VSGGGQALTRHAALALAAVWALGLAGCSSTRVAPPAPVEDRGSARTAPVVVAPAPTAPAVAAAPAAVDLGNQPGYYTVKPGDNLLRIGLENGQNWRDIARWNQLENPNRIEVGQVLRVIPPSATPVATPAKPGAVVAPVAGASSAPSAPGVATAPVTGSAVAAQPLPAAGAAPAPAAAPSAAAPAATAAAAPAPAKPAAAASDDIGFIWPATGSVVAGFDEQKNKGLGIAGKAGEPVLAAAEGRVVYAGSGLRGYGNLIILKHNNTYLTAYAHNQTLLVKEDQNVKQGQKIAEMGNSDADRVKLHFEIRRNGKPVDPAKLLPGR